MTTEVWRKGLAGEVVTWVPGRGRDILQRGFDHAGVLALGLARRTGLRCIPLLERCGRRPDQASLRRGERLVNLRGAFRAGPCAGARVVLVDDLITTGATATACVEALGRAGARSIEVITACRA
jgi:predicted amidophosphoribosyltransferase